MSARGIPIDDSRRLALKELIEHEGLRVDAEIRALVPAEVLSTKQKNGLKRTPKSTEGMVQIEVTVEREEKCSCLKKERPSCCVCHGTGIVPAGSVLTRWAVPTEFNPNSSLQVRRFIKHLKHPIPKHSKRIDAATNEASDTTEMKELERLYAKTKHPIYPLLIQRRMLTKMSGTYVEGYTPSRDGKLHSTYGYGTATWQLTSKAPNVQNSPARGKTEFQKILVEAFNRMLVSSPDCTLVNIDYKSFHAQTTACEAGLPDYLRLAKIDIHAFNACHFIKHSERHGLLKWSDADLKAFFKSLRKEDRIWTNGMTFDEIRNSKTKSAGLGIGFGMQPKKLYMMYREDFESQKEAEAIWNLIMRELFPGLHAWHQAIREKAAEDKRLVSRFGAIRHFWDVRKWDRKQQKFVGGEQAEAAIAFLPASNAFGMIRSNMLEMEAQGLLAKYRLINTTHDSLKFDCPSELVEECLARVKPIAESPSPQMVYPGVTGPEGLSVEVEHQVGQSNADLH
jgi:hypothetical protein